MNKKDLLGLEIKSIMEEDTNHINLSQATIKQILASQKKGFLYRIKSFLNKEVQIPLAPGLLGLAAFLFIASVPKDIFKYESKKVILMEDNPIILSSREVVRK